MLATLHLGSAIYIAVPLELAWPSGIVSQVRRAQRSRKVALWAKVTQQGNAESGLEAGLPDLQAHVGSAAPEPGLPPPLLRTEHRGKPVSQPN